MSARELEAVAVLEWLDRHCSLELVHYSPARCDDDDQAIEWRVFHVSGSINDREWTQIGAGQTPLEALQSAMAKEAIS